MPCPSTSDTRRDFESSTRRRVAQLELVRERDSQVALNAKLIVEAQPETHAAPRHAQRKRMTSCPAPYHA